ncbi:DegT/DnrJ/EryC1/StrS family aminotransferase [Streptomyces chrestomyceticus]|uniref:DegT/DnrJ/EryC1/StrS family aminotransferase n=1 Tax=Streptomyces chrestomyceticus TaxID=68185 RepID=A0ABU7WPT2_9ACTN
MDLPAILGGTPAAVLPERDGTEVTASEAAAVQRCLDQTPLTTLFGGHEIGQFEDAFARRMGSPHAVAVSSGTTALNAALVAAGVRPGDEVIVTPFSFVASVSVVLQAGARPVFADIHPDTFTLDPADVARRITSRTKAILPVHICGYPADMEALNALALEHGLVVVEDCAAAHGARVGDQHVGTLGDFGCFSFNIGKVLRTGEGGMVLTSDPEAAHALRELRVNGISQNPAPNGIARFGFNYSMAQPLAAIGVEQVGRLDEVLAARASAGRRFAEGVTRRGLFTPPDLPDRKRVHYFTPFLLPEALAPHREALYRALVAEGVPASKSCPEPLYRIGYLRPYAPDPGLPVAEDVCRRVIAVDPRPTYNDATMDSILHSLDKVLAHADEIARAGREVAA